MDVILTTTSPQNTNSQREPWQDRALCAEIGFEPFFPETGKQWREARTICARCTVAKQCLDYALRTEEGTFDREGMFGGLTPDERRELMGEPRVRPIRKTQPKEKDHGTSQA